MQIINISSFLEIINPNNLENVTISDYIGSSGLVILINDDITFDTKLDGWVVYYTVNFEPIKVINNIRNSPTPEVDESAEVDPYEDGVYH